MKALVLGGGFAGCTVARLLAESGWHVTLLEKESHLGGGCWTHYYGGHPFTYGPRVYYGYSEKVWKWVNQWVPLRRFPFELRTYVEADGRFYSYPPHEDDIQHMRQAAQIQYELEHRDNSREPQNFEEYYHNKIGPTLYSMFVDQYSRKMWMIDDNKMFDIFKWSAKDRPLESGTREAYKGSYIGYPVPYSGYNSYFEKMIDHARIFTGLSRKWSGELADADVVVSTIPVDEFCGYRFGELPYVGRDFSVFILPCKQVFPGDVRFCHYAGSEPHTRITEFKKITYYESEDTLLVMETPSKKNKLYPYQTKANVALAQRYLDSFPGNVYSIGRLGTYKYSTIEQTIVQAFECHAKITGEANRMEGEFFGIGDVSMMKDRKEK